ncbi:hypothetical protein QTN24_15745 [Cupriavidus sp. SZY C1]|uniref:LPO_1073/Vpar_1526 family protein n=1 Tax=Cupriavidus sp. SZY C1 TaxID=3055037 RepID=UPI0028BB6A1E|nr:LPO_1073/Vpar_1526 family protein [Cupriavidus sp. SZY C1]MDT6962951.1 hypothetical protein [Cupriavidus sp. SZY C1]
MFGDKQSQSVGPYALAIQAQGDINIQGASPEHIDQMVRLFLDYNFPKLRDEALAIARDYVEQFGKQLKESLIAKRESIDVGKLVLPDVQAGINDAVLASARLGSKANPEILCELITERLRPGDDQFKDIVIAAAIRVVPQLTSPQVAMLVLLHSVLEVEIKKDELFFPSLDAYALAVMPLCEPISELSRAQRSHAEAVGVCAGPQSSFKFDIYSALYEKYKGEGLTELVTFKTAISEQAPIFSQLLDIYESQRLFTLRPTSVGSAIAIARLSTVMDGLQMDAWIN